MVRTEAIKAAKKYGIFKSIFLSEETTFVVELNDSMEDDVVTFERRTAFDARKLSYTEKTI